ncbi:hypothetical protein REPUB_Repub12eG0137400 [Reevesia pubescens]
MERLYTMDLGVMWKSSLNIAALGTLRKDQAQYWYHMDRPHSYVSTDKFVAAFKEFHAGHRLNEELCTPFNKIEDHKNALSFNTYSLGKLELFKACLAREWLLMKRNSYLYAFKSAQFVFFELITMTVFIRTQMKIDEFHSSKYMDCLYYVLLRLTSIGILELAFTSSRLGIFYKQRDLYFYPAWAYSIPSAIIKIPFSFLDAFLWTSLVYCATGYSPEPERRFLYAASMPDWKKWGFWISPLSYTEIGISIKEFLAPRWQKVSSSNVTLGHQALARRGLNFNEYFYWISVGALIGMWVLANVGFN